MNLKGTYFRARNVMAPAMVLLQGPFNMKQRVPIIGHKSIIIYTF